MKFASTILLLGYYLTQSIVLGSVDTLTYQITVRDFLPIWCMREQDLVDLDIFGPHLDLTGPNAWTLHKSASGCPYQHLIDSGEISGHPDFNRAHIPGWDFSFLFDNEDTYLENSFVSGSCDRDDLGGLDRPPNLTMATPSLGCRASYRFYSPRINLTSMDMSTSGLPKPQYCVSDENGRCGFYVTDSSELGYQAANKFFHDMWFLDHAKYNKRIGTKLVLDLINNTFEFDSRFQEENEFIEPVAESQRLYAPHGHAGFIFNESDFDDHMELKAWPRMEGFDTVEAVETFEIKSVRKFLHTTEVHTFFEFRGDEIFTFSGDDDVWVYINDRIAIELGGLHPRAEQTINLSSVFAQQYLNITIGGIYTFDLFQAERQPTGSNFKVTTTLSSACNVILSGKSVFPGPSGNSFRKTRKVDFDFEDGQVYNGEPISLLGNGLTSSSSFIFNTEPINVGTGFVVEFDFVAYGEPEGFTFLLHRRDEGLTNFPLSGGGNLGFKSVKKSVAIAFDMIAVQHNTTRFNTIQEVAIYYPDDPEVANKPSASNLRVYDPIMRSLKLNDSHHVKIEYFFKPQALEVTLDDSLYLREFPFDPEATIQSLAAFMGFTAASSETPGNVIISNWTMRSVDVDSTTTIPVDFSTTSVNMKKTVVGDNETETGFTIQSRDFCGLNVEFGGRTDNTAGVYVERVDPTTGLYGGNRTVPVVLDAVIRDTGNGEYGFNLRTDVLGSFDLYFFYGDSEKTCTFDIVTSNVSTLTTVTAEFGNSSDDGCFYAYIEDAVEVVPVVIIPTASPTPEGTIPAQVDDTIRYVAGIGGGILGLFLVLAFAMLLMYRRQWVRDRVFILVGKIYKMEVKTEFNPRDRLTKLTKQVQETQAAILREQASRQAPQSREVSSLRHEGAEMQQMIANLKQRIAHHSLNSYQGTNQLDESL